MGKARYIPDINRLIADYESNYARLLQLLPDNDETCERIFAVTYSNGATVRVCLEVVEVFKYTTTVKLSQDDGLGHWLAKPAMTVRLYHDATVAEVIHYENMRQLRASYGYPNSKMYQSDEKQQLNAYLGEWLIHCLTHGHVIDETIFAETV